MKTHLARKNKPTPMMFHQKLVDQMVLDSPPAGIRMGPMAQWFSWLGASVVVMVLFWTGFGIQDPLSQSMKPMPHEAFIFTAFVGAALAAWESIASSIPGRQTRKGYKAFSIFVLVVLFSIPFIFFAQPAALGLGQVLVNGSGCEEGVALSGLIPWVLMGWMLSRNATFHPWWTGLWSGVSSFLMGTITLQIHCSNWNMEHVLMSHLLPAAVGSLVASFLGSFWFSRWKK